MSIALEDPISTFTRPTPTEQARALTAVVNGNARAEKALAMAGFVANLTGSVTTKQNAIRAAMAAGLLPPGAILGEKRMQQLAKAYREGKVSIADWRDDLQKRGPKDREVPAALQAVVVELAQTAGVSNLNALTYKVNQKAKELGLSPLTRHLVKRVLRNRGAVAISAARHGSRAAELDAMPRRVIPADHTHDRWHLDEGDPRLYAQGWCPIRHTFVSVRPTVVLVRDRCSGAILAYFVADPTRRVSDEGTGCALTGFDHLDVLGALLNAACPDLAPEATRALAGHLPKELRWDNALQHKKLEAELFSPARLRLLAADGGPDPDAEEHPFRTYRPPVRRPDRNGAVERVMGVMKDWLRGCPGHVDEVLPEDRHPELSDNDLGRLRSMVTVGENGRQPRLRRVAVRDLPTVDDVSRMVGEFVHRYNNEHVLARHGCTPAVAAQRFMPKHPRRGDDLVRWLELGRYRVQREGIVVHRENIRYTFTAAVNGLPLVRGAEVQVYIDPFMRGVWVEQFRGLAFQPQAEAAAKEHDARDVAAGAREWARTASDEAAGQSGGESGPTEAAPTASSDAAALAQAGGRLADEVIAAWTTTKETGDTLPPRAEEMLRAPADDDGLVAPGLTLPDGVDLED